MLCFIVTQSYFSSSASPAAFPSSVPWDKRSKQLWIAMWYESNWTLERRFSFSHEFFQSLNGKFNTSITYRADSFIKTPTYALGYHYEKKTTNHDSRGNDANWRRFENGAVKKTG